MGISHYSTNMHIIIVGAGISGLSLAYFLQQKTKHNVVVLERDVTFFSDRQGFSLTMQKTTLNILKEFGLLEQVLSCGYPSKKQIFFDHHGQVLYENGHNDADRFNFPLPRQEIRRVFFEKLTPNTVQFGIKVTDVINDNGTQSIVYEEDGQTKEKSGDLIIACDGINSTLRRKFLPQLKLHDLKLCNVYGITDLSALSKDERSFFDKTEVQGLDGHHRFFSKPFDGTKQMWELTWPLEENSPFYSIYQKLLKDKTAYNEVQELALEACKVAVKDWQIPHIRPFLDATKSPDVIVHPLFDFDPQELNRDLLLNAVPQGIIFIGDALHPMSPYIGMGANEALYDGYLLSQCVDEWTICREKFYSEMVKRSSRSVLRSRANTEFYHTPYAIDKKALWEFKKW